MWWFVLAVLVMVAAIIYGVVLGKHNPKKVDKAEKIVEILKK